MTRYSLIRWTVAGICLGASFLHPFLSPLIIIGLVLFIQEVVASDSVKQVAWGGFIVGIFKYAGALIWFWHAYPLTWLGVAPVLTQLLLIGGVWLINVTLIATSLSAAAVFLYLLYRRHHNYLYSFPLILVASEVLGSLIFSAYSLGPGSTVNIDFSFGYLGYPAAYLPGLLSLGVVGGVYALSFFVGGLSLLIYLIWFKDRQLKQMSVRVLSSVLIIWLITANIYLYLRPIENINADIIAVSTRFDPNLLSQDGGYEIKQAQVKQAVEAALVFDPNIILLPEDSRFISLFATKEEVFDFLYQVAPQSDALVVDSSRTAINDTEVTLRAYLFDLKSHRLHAVDKQHYVPQGEYLPYLFTLWLELTSQENFVSKVTTDRAYRPGPADSYNAFPTHIPSILFCSESVSPTSVAQIVRQDGPNTILHPVSQAWFNNSSILRYQLDRMLRLHAIAHNVHIVQAGNMASSLIYKQNGQVDFGQVLNSGEYFTLHHFSSF